jgi:ketosteroid isomerase-like protein
MKAWSVRRDGSGAFGAGVRKMLPVLVGVLAVMLLAGGASLAKAQVLGGGLGVGAAEPPSPLADTGITPGKALLFDLEARFAKATAEGGGKAFATWFAEDGVSLANGQTPVRGREAIAGQATWLAKDYQLTWTPTDAVMSPAGDMGYTWGHYEGRSHDSDGNAKVTSGRYLTIWRKGKDGWKVVVDTSNAEGADAGDCCRIAGGA